MNFEQLKELIEQVDASDLKVFELENELVSVKMSKNDGVINVTESAPQTEQKQPTIQKASTPQTTSSADEQVEKLSSEVPEDVTEVTAPIVGTAYLSPSPDQDPFVKVGDRIKKGQPLLIVEAMKVMNEIKADIDGEIVNILVEDGQPIEFGQPLIQIK
jgi:acetyl-CoA carboxylase biotin carboxyl carrier protein